ncbi:Cytochrome P [Trema orientale]|uniref:Cytochrome P n=1 Tax=Trema orientale TaxID=63057 RepID=A0A2P5D044_TREOI|nr:Cytochrome P [Trema orientale]
MCLVSTPTILLAILLLFLGSLSFIFLPRAAAWRLNHRKNAQKLPPGPRPLPIIGNLHMLTSLPHRGLQALAQEYGPIMFLWLGNVPTVVVSSPRAAELFLKTHDVVFASRAKVQASEYLSYGTKGMAYSAYGPYWRNVRKLCTLQLLSGSKIESFAALRREGVASLVEWIRGAAAAREVVDVSRKVGELVADMSARMMFGPNLEESYHLKELVHDGLCLLGAFNLADYVPYLEPFDLQTSTVVIIYEVIDSSNVAHLYLWKPAVASIV